MTAPAELSSLTSCFWNFLKTLLTCESMGHIWINGRHSHDHSTLAQHPVLNSENRCVPCSPKGSNLECYDLCPSVRHSKRELNKGRTVESSGRSIGFGWGPWFQIHFIVHLFGTSDLMNPSDIYASFPKCPVATLTGIHGK